MTSWKLATIIHYNDLGIVVHYLIQLQKEDQYSLSDIRPLPITLWGKHRKAIYAPTFTFPRYLWLRELKEVIAGGFI